MSTFRPCVYTGPAGTVPNGAATCSYQTGSLTKSIPLGTVPRKVSCKRVERFLMEISIFVLNNKRDVDVFVLKNIHDLTKLLELFGTDPV